ncbi:MAG: hypothetical protein AB1431_06300 [Pseudomonadota bacterium]
MGALALCAADVRDIDGEPRVLDLRLGEALGMERPRDIRQLIARNVSKLEHYGQLICGAAPQIKMGGRNSRGAGRRATEYLLTERQAYQLCMWSKAPNAGVVQQQMVEVFYAWRHGRLVTPSHDPAHEEIDALRQKLDDMRAIVDMHTAWNSPTFPLALVRSPRVFRFTHADGRVRRQRYSKWQHDEAVMEAVVALHRRMTLSAAVAVLEDRFGKERAPSRSSLGRFWKEALDPMVGVITRPRLQRVDGK